MFPGGVKALARRLCLGVLLLPPVIVLADALHRGYRALPVWYVAISATGLVLGAGGLMMIIIDQLRHRRGRERYFFPRPAADEDRPPSARRLGSVVFFVCTMALVLGFDRYQAPGWIETAANLVPVSVSLILVDVIWATVRSRHGRSRRRHQPTDNNHRPTEPAPAKSLIMPDRWSAQSPDGLSTSPFRP
jgi:hypothetical protein